MRSDVKSVNITATGSAFAGPARVVGIWFVADGVGAGNLVLSDGSGGATKLDLDTIPTATNDLVPIPDAGIHFPNGLWVTTKTNITSATIFYV